MNIITFLKNYSKIYVHILIIITLILRMGLWNRAIKNDYKTIASLNTNKDIEITVKIADIPKCGKSDISFNAKAKSGIDISGMVHVSIKYGEALSLNYGDEISLCGELQTAGSAMNPGNFDYKNYLRSKGVCALLNTDITRISKVSEGKFKLLYEKRKKITQKIFKYLPYREASIVNALVTGSTDEIPDSTKDNLKRAGVYHIVAISGMHLNLFILFLSYIFTVLKINRRKNPILFILLNFCAVTFIFMFTGFGNSIARAAVMAMILFFSAYAAREYSPLHALIFVFYMVMFIKPYVYSDISFQLSFLATAGVISAVYFIQKYGINKFKFAFAAESIVISGCSWLFTLVPTVTAFHGVSLITPLSNLVILLIVTPLMFFSYIFALICITMPDVICQIISCITIVPAKAVLYLTDAFASIPGAYIPMSSKDMIFYIAEAAFALCLLIFIKSKRKKTACLITAAIIIANSAFLTYNIKRKVCEVSFVNVGQGDCSVIKSPFGNSVMIDCGSESVKNIYDYNVMPYLNYEGIYKIDAIIVTHFHIDHTSGIISMIENNKIKKLILPNRITAPDERESADEITASAVKHNIKIEYVCAGDKIPIDPVTEINVLSPDKKIRTDANNSSLVLMMKCYNSKVLFTGDIEESAQYSLLSQNIKADILEIPHHGGFSPFSSEFSDACASKYCVVSCGINNIYSHPAKDTLKAYSKARLYRTDKNGAVKFIIDKSSVKPVSANLRR